MYRYTVAAWSVIIAVWGCVCVCEGGGVRVQRSRRDRAQMMTVSMWKACEKTQEGGCRFWRRERGAGGIGIVTGAMMKGEEEEEVEEEEEEEEEEVEAFSPYSPVKA